MRFTIEANSGDVPGWNVIDTTLMRFAPFITLKAARQVEFDLNIGLLSVEHFSWHDFEWGLSDADV